MAVTTMPAVLINRRTMGKGELQICPIFGQGGSTQWLEGKTLAAETLVYLANKTNKKTF